MDDAWPASNYPIVLAGGVLVLAAIGVVAGSPTFADLASTFAFYLLGLGVTLAFVETVFLDGGQSVETRIRQWKGGDERSSSEEPDVREITAEYLRERPEDSDALRELVALDDSRDEWEFSDTDLDSGTFGELVSRGIVVDDGDGYTVSDSDAVEEALEELSPNIAESS